MKDKGTKKKEKYLTDNNNKKEISFITIDQ
jgi:hypothetical protein